jgi:hypothetical protein
MFWTAAIYWTLVMRDSLLVHRGEPWFTSCSKIGGASTVASLLTASAELLSEAPGSSADELLTRTEIAPSHGLRC